MLPPSGPMPLASPDAPDASLRPACRAALLALAPASRSVVGGAATQGSLALDPSSWPWAGARARPPCESRARREVGPTDARQCQHGGGVRGANLMPSSGIPRDSGHSLEPEPRGCLATCLYRLRGGPAPLVHASELASCRMSPTRHLG